MNSLFPLRLLPTKNQPFPKVSTKLLLLAAVLGIGLDAQSQSANCGAASDAGGTLNSTVSTAFVGELSADPSRTGESSGLDLVEFYFTDPNDIISDPLTGAVGPRVIGSNASGRIDPADLGLGFGDEFCVTSLSISLSVLQRQIDTLYAGNFLGVPCCDFAELSQGLDVCSIMVDQGIVTGSDVTNLAEIIDFGVAYGVSATFESVIYLIDSVINIVPPGSPCTSGDFMCYAYSNTLCYTVDTGGTLSLQELQMPSFISNYQAGPNPVSGTSYQIRFESAWTGDAQWIITDMAGRTLNQGAQRVALGSNDLSFEFSNLPAGMYALQLQGEDWKLNARVAVR